MLGRYFICLSLVVAGLNCCSAQDMDMPGHSPAAEAQRNTEVREAMQRIQVAAEHFAADHGSDHYPTKIDDEFKSYMFGGQEGVSPAPIGEVNKYTGVGEFPEFGSFKDVHSLRCGPRFPVKRGQIIYSPLQNGKGYAIVGGAGDGKVLLDEKNPGQVLVFSNLDD